MNIDVVQRWVNPDHSMEVVEYSVHTPWLIFSPSSREFVTGKKMFLKKGVIMYITFDLGSDIKTYDLYEYATTTSTIFLTPKRYTMWCIG